MRALTPNLKALRAERFLTVDALRQKSGVSRPTLIKLERGGTAYFATVHKLATALDVKPEDLAVVVEDDLKEVGQ